MEKHGITFIILTALTQLQIYSTQSKYADNIEFK